eukprot:jgi/Chrzof1/9076/Cz03g35070.t1
MLKLVSTTQAVACLFLLPVICVTFASWPGQGRPFVDPNDNQHQHGQYGHQQQHQQHQQHVYDDHDLESTTDNDLVMESQLAYAGLFHVLNPPNDAPKAAGSDGKPTEPHNDWGSVMHEMEFNPQGPMLTSLTLDYVQYEEAAGVHSGKSTADGHPHQHEDWITDPIRRQLDTLGDALSSMANSIESAVTEAVQQAAKTTAAAVNNATASTNGTASGNHTALAAAVKDGCVNGVGNGQNSGGQGNGIGNGQGNSGCGNGNGNGNGNVQAAGR